uniref:C2H2-type domain-containing protein n=1 Tax=Vitis vinifera TaxID=29760 RepID=A5BYC1_VITVI|nr:hypothetical protein VITISV_035129 [Vitis vinifera]
MNKSCPVVPSQLTSSTLRSSQFQTNIFCLRERDLLIHFAAEISQLQAHGLSREYALLQIFLDAEAAVSSGPLKSMLSLLRSMHVLIILEEDASFLRYGYLSPDNAAGISKKVTILYSELRPHALALLQIKLRGPLSHIVAYMDENFVYRRLAIGNKQNPPPHPPPPAEAEKEDCPNCDMTIQRTEKARLAHNRNYHKTFLFFRHGKCGRAFLNKAPNCDMTMKRTKKARLAHNRNYHRTFLFCHHGKCRRAFLDKTKYRLHLLRDHNDRTRI